MNLALGNEFRRKQFGTFDTLETRRDLFKLIDRLGDGVVPEVACQRRKKFIKWCIAQCKWPSGIPITMREGLVGVTKETYFTVCSLATVFGLDLEEAAKRLEREVRRYER